MVEANLKVPEDCSVMGFDNLDWSGEVVPPLTTIDLPAHNMGSTVARQLMDHLDFGKPIEPTLLQAPIVERLSVRKIT